VSWNTFNMSTFGFYSMSDGGGFNSNYVYNETDPITGNLYSLSGGSTGSVGATDAGVHYSLFTAASNGDGGENSSFMSYATSAGNSGISTQSHSEGSVTAESQGKFAKTSFSSDVDLSLTDSTSSTTTVMLQNSTSDSNPDGNLLGVIDTSSKQVDYEMILTTDSDYDSRYSQSTVTPDPPADPPPAEGDDTEDNGTGGSEGDSSDGSTGDGSTGGDVGGGSGDGSTDGSPDGGSDSGGSDDSSGEGEDAGVDDAPSPELVENQAAVAFLLAYAPENEAATAVANGEDDPVALAAANGDETTDPGASDTPVEIPDFSNTQSPAPGFDGQDVYYSVSNGSSSFIFQESNDGVGGSAVKIVFGPNDSTSLSLSGNQATTNNTNFTSTGSSDELVTRGDYASGNGSFSKQSSSSHNAAETTGSANSESNLKIGSGNEESQDDDDSNALADNDGEGAGGATGEGETSVTGTSSGSSSSELVSGSSTYVITDFSAGAKTEGALNSDNYDVRFWVNTSGFMETDKATGGQSSSSQDSTLEAASSEANSTGSSSGSSVVGGTGVSRSFFTRNMKKTTLPEPGDDTDGGGGGSDDSTGGSTGGGIGGSDAGSGGSEGTGSTDANAPTSKVEPVVNSALTKQVETLNLVYFSDTPVTSNGAGSITSDSELKTVTQDLTGPPTTPGEGGESDEETDNDSDDETPADGDEGTVTEDDKTKQTQSGFSDLTSSSSYGLKTVDPSYSLVYSSTSTSDYENGGKVVDELDYNVQSKNKAPGFGLQNSGGYNSNISWKADGVHLTADGTSTVSSSESAEIKNLAPIRNYRHVNDGEGTTFTKEAIVDSGDYKVTYDNTTTSTSALEDFGVIFGATWVSEDPDAGDTPETPFAPHWELTTTGTGKSTNTVTQVGDESYKRHVRTTEEKHKVDYGGGEREDVVEIDLSGDWNLTDVVKYEFATGETSADETGPSLPKGYQTLSHEISGTQNSGGTVNTRGGHDYDYDYTLHNEVNNYDYQKQLEQDGGYFSTGTLGSTGSRSGTITLSYDAEGNLLGASGAQTATIDSDGSSDAYSYDFAKATITKPGGETDIHEETRTKVIDDSFDSTASSTRTAGVESDDSGKLTYLPTYEHNFSNHVDGKYKSTENQKSTHIEGGVTSPPKTAVVVTEPTPYDKQIGSEGFYSGHFGSFGFRGDPTDPTKVLDESGVGLPDDGESDESSSSGNDGGTVPDDGPGTEIDLFEKMNEGIRGLAKIPNSNMLKFIESDAGGLGVYKDLELGLILFSDKDHTFAFEKMVVHKQESLGTMGLGTTSTSVFWRLTNVFDRDPAKGRSIGNIVAGKKIAVKATKLNNKMNRVDFLYHAAPFGTFWDNVAGEGEDSVAYVFVITLGDAIFVGQIFTKGGSLTAKTLARASLAENGLGAVLAASNLSKEPSYVHGGDLFTRLLALGLGIPEAKLGELFPKKLTPGNMIGQGANKDVFEIVGNSKLVAAFSENDDILQLTEELENLRRLEATGEIPVVKAHGIELVNGRPALILENFPNSNLMRANDFSDFAVKRISKEGLEDLMKMRKFLENNEVIDFQFLLTENGRAFLIDPLGFTPGRPSLLDHLEFLDELIRRVTK